MAQKEFTFRDIAADRLPLKPRLTDDEMLELGRRVHDEHQPGFEFDGRAMTNLEMYASRQYGKHKAHQEAALGVCCGKRRDCLGLYGMCSYAAHICPEYAVEDFVMLVTKWCNKFDKESVYGNGFIGATEAEPSSGQNANADDDSQGQAV
jgi:hypothetical protein